MPADFSFDVVSEFDHQELVNAVDQTQREMRTRYDFKDTKSELLLEKDAITITAPAEMQLTAIKDILESKMVRRNLSLKILDFGKIEDAAGAQSVSGSPCSRASTRIMPRRSANWCATNSPRRVRQSRETRSGSTVRARTNCSRSFRPSKRLIGPLPCSSRIIDKTMVQQRTSTPQR